MNRYRFDDVAHIHLLDGKPLYGTSTIVGVISKGSALVWWGCGKALEPLGWTPTKGKKADRLAAVVEPLAVIKYMTDSDFLKILDECYKNHKKKLDESAVKGIDMHSMLEMYIKDQMKSIPSSTEYHSQIMPFVNWCKENVQEFLFSEAFCYSEKLWVGGIADAGAILKDSSTVLIDFKSAKEAYKGHFIQAAGYALQIEENGFFDKDGNIANPPIVFDKLIVVPFGAEKVEPVFNVEPIGDYKKAFINAKELYSFVK